MNPNLWIAAIVLALLGGTHTWAYRSGEHAVQSHWDADVARRTAQALAAETAARAKETELAARLAQTERTYAEDKRKADVAISGARTELDRLRDALAATPADRPACENPASTARAYASTRTERELFGQCATALTSVAAQADRLQATVVGLQHYVRDVCLQ